MNEWIDSLTESVHLIESIHWLNRFKVWLNRFNFIFFAVSCSFHVLLRFTWFPYLFLSKTSYKQYRYILREFRRLTGVNTRVRELRRVKSSPFSFLSSSVPLSLFRALFYSLLFSVSVSVSFSAPLSDEREIYNIYVWVYIYIWERVIWEFREFKLDQQPSKGLRIKYK